MDARRNNKGKRKGDKIKVPITIYKPLDEVKIVGGMEAARAYLSETFDWHVETKSNS